MQGKLFSGYGRVIALFFSLVILAGCGGGSGSGGQLISEDGSNNGSNNQTGLPSGADIEAICALPTLGPAVVSAAGGDCGQSEGGASFDASALCAVPVLGPLVVSGSGGGDCAPTDGSSPLDSLPMEDLEALCAIPSLGPIILDSVGGICPGEDATPFSTISVGFICSIPELGEPIAMAMGENCSDTPSGPLNPGLLCMVPVIGQLLVEAGGFECLVPTALSNPQDLACQVAPLQAVLDPLCPLPDPEALCVIPVLGPGLVEPLLGSCPDTDTGDGLFLPPLEL